MTAGLNDTAIEINRNLAEKVLKVVDQGLCCGLGIPEPGKLCVEAAVCYAMGLPHSDEPTCVSPALRRLKIALNDKSWSSNAARAKGLRRLAITQLGSAGALDEKEFLRRVAIMTVSKVVPRALRLAASVYPQQEQKEKLEAAAVLCEVINLFSSLEEAKKRRGKRQTRRGKRRNTPPTPPIFLAARDTSLAAFAEDVVRILIDMKAPGCEWLDLTEAA